MKNILITGASRGIGKAIHDVLRKQGYFCITPSREILDISNAHSIEKYFQNNDIEFYGLVNNAGINILSDIDSLKYDNIDCMLNTNLISPLLLTKYVSKSMKKNNIGKIVNIGSIWGVASKEHRTLYSATKFALNGITKSLSKELGIHNILINTVAPGYVNTEMTLKNVSEKEQNHIKSSIPLKRFAEPIEIAELVHFLLSEKNTYITGQTIIADGGYLP